MGDECTYRCADVLYDTKGNKIQDGEKHWVTKRLWDANSSCYAHFIQDIKSKTEQECSSEDVAKELAQLNKAITSNSKLEYIKDLVLSTCLSSLRGLSYSSIEHLLQKVTSQEKLDNQSELVVLRLMNAINGRDYPHFYSLLEANNNKLLKFLVREMDDASILFWTNDNYTNFIGALVWMFNSDNCKSIINRLPNNAEDYAQRVVNLKPITYEVPKAAFGKISLSTKHNDGKYDSETGEIELRDVYTTYLLNTAHHFGPNIAKLAKEDSITSLSPLTPIIIVPEDDKLPLIQTALSGGGLSNQMYIVPAIFLKYRFDKIRNDKIEKAVVTTLDVATIVLSGGTALATKVHWIRRAWALAEVVGAVGNIAVNTQVITNQQVKDAIGIYNTAMGLIGLKNAGVAGYKFVKNLPNGTKNILQGGLLKDIFRKPYIEFKAKISYEKSLGNYAELDVATKETLAKQELILGTIANSVGKSKRIFTQQEIDEYLIKATKHNPRGKKQVMLGKYDSGTSSSYISRAGDEYTYFDLGDKGWDEAYQIVQSDEQMWRINKAFLKQQKERGCEFYFSHNPFDPKIRTGFTAREIEYLTRSIEEGGLGGRINPTPIGGNLWKVEF